MVSRLERVTSSPDRQRPCTGILYGLQRCRSPEIVEKLERDASFHTGGGKHGRDVQGGFKGFWLRNPISSMEKNDG